MYILTPGETSESNDNDSCDDMESVKDHQVSYNPTGPVFRDSNITLGGADLVSTLPPNEHLLVTLGENNYNWFAFVEELNMMLCNDTCEQFYHVISPCHEEVP